MSHPIAVLALPQSEAHPSVPATVPPGLAVDAVTEALRRACPDATVHPLSASLRHHFCAEHPGAVLLMLGDAPALLAQRGLLSAADAGSTGPVHTVGLIGPPPEAAQLGELMAAGLDGWWPAELAQSPQALAAVVQVLQGLQAQRAALATAERAVTALRQQIDERKWIERAKGVLMTARGIAEQDAFVLLRGAAMHANLRLADLSRAVTETAQWAEALNRAGQMRMLSQRALRLLAQRVAGLEANGARSTQKAVADRLADTLRFLQRLDIADAAELPHARATVTADGEALLRLLEERPSLALLPRADAAAQALLDSADRLASALERHCGRQALHIVNLCGRQRMRVQRLAKEALLAALLADDARSAALPALLDDFEHSLNELEAAPLSTPDIRAALAETRNEWLRLLRNLREASSPGRGTNPAQGQLAFVHASDRLLDLFERLTDAYEHSLQVLMA